MPKSEMEATGAQAEGKNPKEAAADVPAESKYPRGELIANAQAIFNVGPEVVVGALYGNTAEELTVSEVKQAVQNFLKRKVK